MADRMKGKVCLVVGAGASGPGWGNGKATAVLFAREGGKVFGIDINEAAVAETAAVIAREGGAFTAHVADVSKEPAVEAAVARCIETYGRVDVLVNVVGIVEVGGPVEMSTESWDRVMAVNMRSMFLTCKFVLPHMERQGSGAIVNFSSIAAIRYTGVPYASYNATKAAALGFTRSIALQYAGKGIRCNAILPGLMNTPMIVEPLKGIYGEGDVDRMVEVRDAQCPMGRMGDAWDVAYGVLYLASNEAKYVTGIGLPVDGGITCKYS